MQIDMHYYGTRSIARAAGLNSDSANIVGYAAQFVDDNIAVHVDDHDDGSKIISVPTAHHAGDLSNRDEEDQRYIWVPFHFIPGNEGSSFTERLICRKNSAIARQMMLNHIAHGGPYARELVGLGAHVYADTFAHWGFSGVGSRRNKVIGDSFVLHQEDAVVEAALGQTFGSWMGKYGGLVGNIRSRISGLGELYSGSLGHGAVSSYPDMPFLQWEFTYEHTGETVYHDNPATYLEGAEALYQMFAKFANENDQYRGATSVPFSELKERIAWIYAQEGNKWERADVWKAASMDGAFGLVEEIPEYEADTWNNQCEGLEDMDDGAEALELPVHRFFRAASYHVHYVLRDLLPSHGLMVV